MGIKCGIVGLPNVGKSTLFNAVTQAQNAAAANYPFCTIDPNVGVVPVPDLRLQALASIVKPEKILPTTVEFVDIAGLVAGASEGEGLGNKFLAHIREVDAVAHVVRCFENDDIVHVAGRIDPLRDIDIIDTELALADLETVEKGLLRAEKAAKAGDKDAIKQRELLKQLRAHLDQGKPARSLPLDAAERLLVRELRLITAKPLMYVANVAEDGFVNNPLLDAVRARAETEGADVVAVCAEIEAQIAQLDEGDRAAFLEELGLDEPGLESRDPRGLSPARICRRSSPRAPRKCARGPCVSAPRRRRPPARSTPISRRASSARKSSRYDDYVALQGRAGREGSRASCGSRARNTSCARRRHALPLQRRRRGFRPNPELK